MVDEKKGERAELPTLGEIAQIEMASESNDALSKRTLKIWDVPTELASKFIATARGSYANKSWLYLQDLMRKADQYDQMISSGRLEDHERRIVAIEAFVDGMEKALNAPEEKEEKAKTKTPKTFGGI
jgi:hypothetical protein